MLAETLSDDIVAIVFFPLTVLLVFTLHELGHYVAARLCGVRVLSFDVGIGPRVLRWTSRQGTMWTVRLMPLCGLVRLAGQQRESCAVSASRDMYCARPVWQRMLIVAAGPAVNLLLAFVFIAGFYVSVGIPATPAVLAGIEIGSAADKAGWRPGDRIAAINGQPVAHYQQLRPLVNALAGRAATFTVARGDETFTSAFVIEELRYNDMRGFARVDGRTGGLFMPAPLRLSAVHEVAGTDTKDRPGKAYELLRARAGRETEVALYSTDLRVRHYRAVPNAAYAAKFTDRAFFRDLPVGTYLRPGAGAALAQAGRDTARLIGGTLHIAVQMWPVDTKAFTPAVVVARDTAPVAHDFFVLLYIGALMSVFVAFFNLLPLPWLDGGALVALVAEAALGPERGAKAAPYVVRSTILVCFTTLAFFHAADFRVFIDRF